MRRFLQALARGLGLAGRGAVQAAVVVPVRAGVRAAGALTHGQAGAMGREALGDIRNTLHQIAFGRPESPGMVGAPLNPPAQIVTEQLRGRQAQIER